MKAITFSLLMLELTISGFAQTPGGPVSPAAQAQSAAPTETASSTVSAPAVSSAAILFPSMAGPPDERAALSRSVPDARSP